MGTRTPPTRRTRPRRMRLPARRTPTSTRRRWGRSARCTNRSSMCPATTSGPTVTAPRSRVAVWL